MNKELRITKKEFDIGNGVAWDFARRVHHATTVTDVVKCVQEAFQGIVPESCVALWLWDEEKQKACRVLYKNQPGHAPLPQFLDASHPILAAWLGQTEAREAVVHRAGTRDLGVLQCMARTEMNWLSVRTTNDLRLLLTICSKAQEAIDNSIKRFISFMTLLSLQQLQRARLQEERDLLAKIANLAHQSHTRSDFLTAVAREVRAAFAAGGCTLFLYDSARKTLYSQGTTGLEDPRTRQPLTEVEYLLGDGIAEGITGWIGQRRQTLRLFNARDAEELRSIDPTGQLKMGTKSRETHVGREDSPRPFLGAPIFLGDQSEPARLLGVIRLSQKQEQHTASAYQSC